MDDAQHEAYGAMIHRGKVEERTKEMVKETKLCKDCKWSRPFRRLFFFSDWEFAACDAPQNRKHSPVDGTWKRKTTYCDMQRNFDDTDDDRCGFDAKWFMLKQR